VLDTACPEPVVRRLTEGAAEVLERLSAGSLSEGQVNLICIDDIARAFGPRWSSKKVQVYDHVEGVLERVLMGCGFFARVSVTDYLVVQPSLGQFGAQAVCYRAFQEIWTHFLGKQPQPERTVHRVIELSANEITATEVNPTDAMAGEAWEKAEAESQALARARTEDSPLSPTKWTPFVASDGRHVDVVCALEPVYNLKTMSRIAFRFRRKVVETATSQALTSAEVAALSRSDLFRIDMATMSRALMLLEEDPAAEPELSLIIPASYIALCHPASRQAFTAAMNEFKGRVKTGVIFELHDLAGAPHSILTEILSAVRSQCILAVGHLPPDPPPRSLKDAGLQALSVSCPSSVGGDAEFIGWLRRWLRSAHGLTRSVMVYNCASSRRIALASLMGATHGSVAGADV
jgi:hypothetical protein